MRGADRIRSYMFGREHLANASEQKQSKMSHPTTELIANNLK